MAGERDMSANTILITADGNIELIYLDFSDYRNIYKCIDCESFAIVRCYGSKSLDEQGIMMYVDDESLCRENPVFNPVASLIYGFDVHQQGIYGSAVFSAIDDLGKSNPLTEDNIKLVRAEIVRLIAEHLESLQNDE